MDGILLGIFIALVLYWNNENDENKKKVVAKKDFIMKEVRLEDLDKLKEGDIIFYIPNHLLHDVTFNNAEPGRVKRVDGEYVFVRYTLGDTAARTHYKNLFL